MQYLLIKLLVGLRLRCLKGNLLVREQHEVVDKNLGSLLQSVLRVDGTVRGDFQHELVVVGLLLDTIRLNAVFHVTDRCVNRVDCYHVHISAELAVLVGGDVAATLVDREVNLHRCLGI